LIEEKGKENQRQPRKQFRKQKPNKCVCKKKTFPEPRKPVMTVAGTRVLGPGAEALVCCGSREEDEKVAVCEEWNCLEKRE
jgi:hypothetical protein